MLTDLRTWKIVVDCERELAISRAARLGPLGIDVRPAAHPVLRLPSLTGILRRPVAPMLRVMRLRRA